MVLIQVKICGLRLDNSSIIVTIFLLGDRIIPKVADIENFWPYSRP